MLYALCILIVALNTICIMPCRSLPLPPQVLVLSLPFHKPHLTARRQQGATGTLHCGSPHRDSVPKGLGSLPAYRGTRPSKGVQVCKVNLLPRYVL